jgi:hypothetical protein
MTLATRTITIAAILSLVLPVGAAVANPEMLMDAIKAGLPAKNCQYCHTEATPVKETFKPEALNDRGKFLRADMQARKLKAADMQKLKEFPGGTQQK